MYLCNAETCTYVEKCKNLFLKGSAGVYTFLFLSKIHPNTEIRDRHLSPSKVVTFLYVGSTCRLWLIRVHI